MLWSFLAVVLSYSDSIEIIELNYSDLYLSHAKILANEGRILDAIELAKEVVLQSPTHSNIEFLNSLMTKFGMEPISSDYLNTMIKSFVQSGKNTQKKSPTPNVPQNVIYVDSKGDYYARSGNKIYKADSKTYREFTLDNGTKVYMKGKSGITAVNKSVVIQLFNGVKFLAAQGFGVYIREIRASPASSKVWIVSPKDTTVTLRQGNTSKKVTLKKGQVMEMIIAKDISADRFRTSTSLLNIYLKPIESGTPTGIAVFPENKLPDNMVLIRPSPDDISIIIVPPGASVVSPN